VRTLLRFDPELCCHVSLDCLVDKIRKLRTVGKNQNHLIRQGTSWLIFLINIYLSPEIYVKQAILKMNVILLLVGAFAEIGCVVMRCVAEIPYRTQPLLRHVRKLTNSDVRLIHK
jgi:hypothetical protein